MTKRRRNIPTNLIVRAVEMPKELEEKRNDLLTRADEILNKAKAEKRALSDDEITEMNKIKADVQKIKDTLKIGEEFRELEPKTEKKDAEPTGTESTEEEKAKAQEEAEVRAFDSYIRGTVNERAETKLVPSENGAVIPTTIANRIIKKVYDICPILDKSTKYNVKGTIDLPYYDTETDTVEVAYQEEFKQLTSHTGNFKSIRLSGFLAGALSLVSQSLINKSNFNLVDFVVNEMSESIKRFIEKELLNGTEGKVEGLSKLTTKVTSKSATAITGDDLILTKDSIKDAFQNNAMWIMSSKTRTALRLLKDAQGRYLLQDDVTAPFGTTLLGKPVYVSDNMSEIESGKTAIFYGDFSGLATKFDEAINVQVLREKYADMHAVGVIGWLEFDSKVENAQKITQLVMA